MEPTNAANERRILFNNNAYTGDSEQQQQSADVGGGRRGRAQPVYMRYLPCCWTPSEFLNAFGTLAVRPGHTRGSGAIYVFIVMLLMYVLNAYVSCPYVLGDDGLCTPYVRLGQLCVGQVLLNFVLFHYFR
jgi:hypothetical protein